MIAEKNASAQQVWTVLIKGVLISYMNGIFKPAGYANTKTEYTFSN